MTLLSQNDFAKYEKQDKIKTESSNFKFAFYTLSKAKREAIINIYAFCSYLDDIVDSSSNDNEVEIKEKLARLNWWKKEIDKIYTEKQIDLVPQVLKNIVVNFAIPKDYFYVLIEGIVQDLRQKDRASFEELQNYCYGVAGIVGLICICIFGDTSQEAKKYAINLGYALQLTNIIRDVNADFERGYIYLPNQDFEKFNYSKSDLEQKKYNENFINLMDFQYKRALEFYRKAEQNLINQKRSNFIAAEIMKNIYFEILQKIEKNNFNIFSSKTTISTGKKIYIAIKTIFATLF